MNKKFEKLQKIIGVIICCVSLYPFSSVQAGTVVNLFVKIDSNSLPGVFTWKIEKFNNDGWGIPDTFSLNTNPTFHQDVGSSGSNSTTVGVKYRLTISSDPQYSFNITCTGPDGVFDIQDKTVVMTLPHFEDYICDAGAVPPVYKTPILIVPGVLGTDLSDSDGNLLWANEKMTILPDSFMDGLIFDKDLNSEKSIAIGDMIRSKNFAFLQFDYSKTLISDLVSQGYTEGKDLFTFPYDWRYGASGLDANGNEVNVNALKGQIDYILSQTDAGKAVGKVDLVAHSTGGLIVKKYVMEHPDDNHIAKAVFVGVPNEGSPKATKVLLQGDNFGVPGLSDAEMKKLAKNMPVVYDLAPSQNYIDSAGSDLHVKDPPQSQGSDLNFSDAWDWLTQHNFANATAVSDIEKFRTTDFENFNLAEKVDLYNIIGCASPTFNKIDVNVINNGKGYSFKDLKLASGDGTVPVASAQSVPTAADHTYYLLKASHGQLLSSNGSRQEIVKLLTGADISVDSSKVKTAADLSGQPGLCNVPKGKFLGIFSPVSIQITDQDGNQDLVMDNGSIQNNIPGADYEVWGEQKFVYLPTDDNQTYTVNLQGTGNGTFTLEESDFDNGEISNTQGFVNVPVTTDMSGILNLTDTTLNWNNQDLVPGDYSAPTPDTTPPTPTYGGGVILTFSEPSALSGKVLAAVTYKDGTLVLDTTDNRTVYMIWHGKKYGFTSDKVFLASKFHFEDVTSGDLSSVPLGGLF